ncbi:expressed protein [Echinococcus multilocularis]|uniref:Expressed protein n=1 Tax=Echinococcus multilocularis TaxID=6211 RepID=A0A068Y719_ECHMU|nr:expressed protein [Echinococcus multilocularis]
MHACTRKPLPLPPSLPVYLFYLRTEVRGKREEGTSQGSKVLKTEKKKAIFMIVTRRFTLPDLANMLPLWRVVYSCTFSDSTTERKHLLWTAGSAGAHNKKAVKRVLDEYW